MLDLDFLDLKGQDADLQDSQILEEFGKTHSYKYELSDREGQQSKNDLQSLIYTNLSLEYDTFLYEEELKYYKVILADKESQIKRLKEMHNKRFSKLNGILDSIKRLNKKIKDVSDGYRLMAQKKQDCRSKEEVHRNQRLTLQEKKNSLYQRYCQLEESHRNIMAQIEGYEGYQAEYNQITNENQQIKQEIAELESRKQQIQSGFPNNRREELKVQIKKLYQKIKNAQKEEQRICKEYEAKKKKRKALQEQQGQANRKGMELNSLYARLARLKEDCKERKWVKLEREKQYHELLAEESHLKRQLAEFDGRMQRRISQEKPKYVHNFRIIDSEADEQLGRGNKHFRSSSQKYSSESQQQFDELIDRFHRLKSKSKNLS